MTGIVLCAGFGSRLRPLTLDTPKPAIPFFGAPLGLWAAQILRECGVKDIIVNAHYKPETIEHMVKSSWLNGITKLSIESDRPLGSGGALQQAKRFISREVTGLWIINGDEVILPSSMAQFPDMWEQHIQHDRLATLGVISHPEVGTKFGGVWTDDALGVLGFGRDKNPKASMGYHYIGVAIMSPRILRYLPLGESNLLYDGLIAGMASGETVKANLLDADWFETGQLRDFLQAQLFLTSQYDSLAQNKKDFVSRLVKSHCADFESRGLFHTRESIYRRLLQAEVNRPIYMAPEINLPDDMSSLKKSTSPLAIGGWGQVTQSQLDNELAQGGSFFMLKDGSLVSLNQSA